MTKKKYANKLWEKKHLKRNMKGTETDKGTSHANKVSDLSKTYFC